MLEMEVPMMDVIEQPFLVNPHQQHQHQQLEFCDMQIQFPVISTTPHLKRKSTDDLSESEEVTEVVHRIKKFKFPLYIKVQTLNGRTIDLDLDSNDPVERIKELVQQREGIPANQQKLVFNGKQLLQDTHSVDSYGIVDGCVVFLIVALPHAKGYSGISREHRINNDE